MFQSCGSVSEGKAKFIAIDGLPIMASATLPFCSFIAAGFHALCSIDIGDTPYQEGRALFQEPWGIGEEISIRRILSQRYERDS